MLRHVLCLVMAAVSLVAADAARLGRLYSTFMAPCCWHENLGIHQSPAAEELRAEIRRMVDAGATDDQIKAQMVANHTARILAMPEGATGQWLSWMPWLFAALGIATVAWWLRRSSRPRPAPVAAGPVAVVKEEDLEW